MWSSVEEIYPVHTSMLQSPQGASVLKEPVTERPQDNTEIILQNYNVIE